MLSQCMHMVLQLTRAPGPLLRAGSTTRRNIINSTTDVSQVGRRVVETCRHRPMVIGAALADDQRCYFIIGRQEKLCFGVKTRVQCSDQLEHKIALKFSKM